MFCSLQSAVCGLQSAVCSLQSAFSPDRSSSRRSIAWRPLMTAAWETTWSRGAKTHTIAVPLASNVNRFVSKSSSLRKQSTFREVATWTLAKPRLSNEHRNNILMTCHYPDLGSASDWLKREGILSQPIRRTTKMTRHQYGISALVTQTASFCEDSSGDLARRRLFSQATSLQAYNLVQRCSPWNFPHSMIILACVQTSPIFFARRLW